MLKKIIIYSILVLTIGIIAIFSIIVWSNYLISSYSKEFIYDNIDSIPHNKAGLLLGTSKYTTDGRINLFLDIE